MNRISRLTELLEPQERKKLYRFGILSLFSPVAELFSVSMIIPIFSRAFYQTVTAELLMQIVFLGVVLLLVGGFELLKSRAATELVMDIYHSWSTRIYELYALEDVGAHNRRTAAQAMTGARYDVGVASELVTTVIALCINLLTIGAYFCVLIYLARWVGAVSCAVMAATIAVLYRRNRARIARFGEEKWRLEKKASGIISTAYEAYKEIKIDSRRDYFLRKYQRASADFARAQKYYAYMMGFQGIVLENMMQAGMFFLLAFLMAAGVNLSRVLPEAMVFLILLIRMVPSSKRVVNALTSLRFGWKCLDAVEESLREHRTLKQAAEAQKALRKKTLTLKEGIRVRGLTFRYPDGKLILEGADMDIPAGESTVVIGPSGEGKTTFLDLILGLLRPEAGHIWYDDYDLAAGADADGPCRADLGDVVSYIPQMIYLNNETVRSNVVFMSDEDGGDEERVKDCLKCAQIWEEVSRMPEGMDTVIGQNGMAVSGGQRQRIALARALYQDFEILIMDEATAALDMETEQAVIDSIRNLKGNKTLLMVTHHMSLAKECEHVYQIEDHKLRKVR